MLFPRPLRDQHRAPYAEAVEAHARQDWLRLNVPGHAADPTGSDRLAHLMGQTPLRLDVPPLVEGLDLGDPNPMDEALQLAAEAWGARRTWFLTNGASQGNRIATLAARSLGRTLVVQRSVHSSVIDGLVLSGLNAAFVHPSVDAGLGIAHGVTPADLAQTLAAHQDTAAAHVVTPSYFGAVADVRGLAEAAHAAGVPLIVDEAWGSHFGFHPDLPSNALDHGADLVVSSTHKLTGSLTQSAMLHLADGAFADVLEPLIQRAFHLTQSTSASALLLASLDVARQTLATGRKRIAGSIDAAEDIRRAIRSAGRFAVVSDDFDRFPDITASDPLRVPIDTRSGGISGHEARRRLMRDHRVMVEVATDSAVVAVIGACSVPQPARFVGALHALPVPLGEQPIPSLLRLPAPGPVRMTTRQAFLASSRTVRAQEAIGRISADTLAAYPPGIPNILPGEVVTAELVDFFHRTVAAPNGHVRGAADPGVVTMRVVREGPLHL
ncbi:arginine decarboxylase [Kitasatospora herbaricolor]|uniref:aminotransferase class I/II-fold pyridoxal phosphate-dependent enzyme n=1 Tax=Kitasatospora herbaricolor TaxID=68217 RepID=UPI00174DBEDF|nr:PLP-dependent transferase [Kitasatospora herbaricolor]MDQ0305879.1 arginine/lysine/ornithine decarboxylase [Kitasatospora herbaricolor]GGV38256.1 arginine decarboxylase [Kitasatospora herbaricolor]